MSAVSQEAPGAVPIPATGSAGVLGVAGEKPPLPLSDVTMALLSCVAISMRLLVRGRVHQPGVNVGRRVVFADGSAAVVYRETVIDRLPPNEPTVLVVTFRLRAIRRNWAHVLFRVESELNTVLFAGFPGLVSKLWLTHDQHGRYRGFHQWVGPRAAEVYVRALWSMLAVVSEPGSIHYAVLPGLERDEVLRDPTGDRHAPERAGRVVETGLTPIGLTPTGAPVPGRPDADRPDADRGAPYRAAQP